MSRDVSQPPEYINETTPPPNLPILLLTPVERQAQSDEQRDRLEESADLSSALEQQLFVLKKRYMEQRGMNAKLMLEVQALKGLSLIHI